MGKPLCDYTVCQGVTLRGLNFSWQEICDKLGLKSRYVAASAYRRFQKRGSDKSGKSTVRPKEFDARMERKLTSEGPKQPQYQFWEDQGDVELLLSNKRGICTNYPSCSTQVRHQRQIHCENYCHLTQNCGQPDSMVQTTQDLACRRLETNRVHRWSEVSTVFSYCMSNCVETKRQEILSVLCSFEKHRQAIDNILGNGSQWRSKNFDQMSGQNEVTRLRVHSSSSSRRPDQRRGYLAAR